MEKNTIILLFFFFGLNYAAKTIDPKILDAKSITKQQAAEALSEITFENALPLVLYKDKKNNLQLPSELETVAIIDGKMVHGTAFSSEVSSDQMFLCPGKNSHNNCLVRKYFKKKQPLQCDEEVIPNVEYKNRRCGAGEVGHLYGSFYRVCDGLRNKFHPKEVNFYDICYHENKRQSLFSHHNITSPQLLNSALLFREREVKYEMRHDLKLFVNKAQKNVQTEHKTDSGQRSTKSGYQEQKLVPSEDMALALWRKTTFQRVNTALQHEQLVDLWNEICDHIRRRALYNTKIMDVEIYTGVFDTGFISKDTDTQIYNIWVKLIYYYHEDLITEKKSLQPNDGVVILMNNFIDTTSSDLTESSLDERNNLIEQYCDQDFCVDYLKNKFKQVRGNIRCCPVTEKILNLFGRENDPTPQLSHILYVTTERETLYEINVTEDQVAYSLREIGQNEVLPIVLYSKAYGDSLRIPSNIHKAEIMNGRIVSGTTFYVTYYDEMYFCPNVNTDDTCLAPQKFNKLEPLQCVEKAIPMIEKLPKSENQCGQLVGVDGDGDEKGGTIHRVVYKICAAKEGNQNYNNENMQLYEFCYNRSTQKVLFTNHRIRSPWLLFSKLLMRERAVEYSLEKDDGFPLTDLQEFENTVNPLIPQENDGTKKSVYKLQKLVPPEDMALALCRKSTYKYTNIEWQHEKLIPLWDDINRMVRKHAFKWNQDVGANMKNYVGISIYTGVFETQPPSQDNMDGEKSNMWVKIIYEDEENITKRGTAIIMNNFLITKTTNPIIQDSDENTPLKKYCEKNLCSKALKTKFEKIGGQIRCCPLTADITKLFNIPAMKTNVNLITIRGIIDYNL